MANKLTVTPVQILGGFGSSSQTEETIGVPLLCLVTDGGDGGNRASMK